MNETTPSQPPAFLIEVDVTKRIGKPESTTRGTGDKVRELSEAQMQNAFALVEKVAARARRSRCKRCKPTTAAPNPPPWRWSLA